MISHDFSGGLKALAEATGMNYRTMKNRAARPREIREYELIAIEDELSLPDEEITLLRKAIREG